MRQQLVTSTPTSLQLAGTLARSLKMNDEQCASGEITRDVWLDTDKALWAYADKHGVSADVRAMANRAR